MKKLTALLLLSLLLPAGFCADEPILITNAPAHGTFRLLYQQPSPPYPFDPTYGALPIWLLNGVYYVDDSEVDYVTLRAWQLAESALSSPSPPGIGGGGGSSNVVCDGPTNFIFAYQLNAAATTNVWLQFSLATSHTGLIRLHTADTNASYDLFATTNLSPCVPPVNLTNWCRVLRAPPQPVSFTWTNLDGCQVWFQAATLTDDDGDGLTTAYEHLVSLTDPNVADTDDDGRSDAQELADATDPRSAGSVVFTRLAAFPFNDTNFTGGAAQLPLVRTNAISAAAWLSPGVQLANGTNAQLRYRGTETNGTANLNLRHGAVRFWFKSTWDTGTGPATFARLLEVGTQGSGGTTNGWWALHFSQTNGSQIAFAAETNGAGATYLTGTVSWARCDWNQLVLNYTPSNTALYLNSSLVATGLGVTCWPGATVRADGFTVGSDASGGRQALGLFEDLETFNHPLATNDIAENFQTNRPPNAIADLQLWLKGDAVALQSGSTNKVFRWLDQTCNQIDGIQALPGTQPFLSPDALNGRPAISFFSTNNLELPTFPTNWIAAETFVVMAVTTNVPGSARSFWNFGSQSQYPNADGAIVDGFGRTVFSERSQDPVNLTGMPTLPLTRPHIYHVVTQSNEWTSRINGLVHYSVLSNSVLWNTGLKQIGSGSGGFDGVIGEMLVFNRSLSTSERDSIYSYLNGRYGFITSVPNQPTNVTARPVSATDLLIQWAETLTPTNRSFTVERRSGLGAFTAIAVLANSGSYLDSGLTTNTAYDYRVKAGNWVGASPYSVTASATTLVTGASFPVSDLKQWLKADAGHGGGFVNIWADQSGNERHAIQHSRTLQPVVVAADSGPGGLAVGFYGTNSLTLQLFRPNDFPNSAEGFLVLRRSSVDCGLWTLGAGLSSYPTSASTVYDNFFRQNTDTAAGSLNHTNWHLYNPLSTSSGWSSRTNRITANIYSGLGHIFGGVPTHRVIAQPNNNNDRFQGQITEFLIFNRALSSDERATVENYCNQRYSLW